MSLNVDLLEASFNALAPRADELADTFYEMLLGRNPELRPLFARSDMAEQKKKLIASLALVVANLRRPETLNQAVSALGARHNDYNVREEHYPLVGAALLESLAAIAGPAWNDELQQAWAQAYQVISGIMITAAREARRAA